MAPILYKVALILLACILILYGVQDYILYRHGWPTITAWLRQHPWYYIGPAIVVVIGLVVFALHLFVFVPHLERRGLLR